MHAGQWNRHHVARVKVWRFTPEPDDHLYALGRAVDDLEVLRLLDVRGVGGRAPFGGTSVVMRSVDTSSTLQWKRAGTCRCAASIRAISSGCVDGASVDCE